MTAFNNPAGVLSSMNTLINTGESIPKFFYIFVKMLNPTTWHNFTFTQSFASGAFSSLLIDQDYVKNYLEGKLRYLPYEPCKNDNIIFSPYFLTAINDYRVEYDVEVYREKKFPLYPSRLSATYAFGDIETCEKVSSKYGEDNWKMSDVRKFELKENKLNRVAKVNMEIISFARDSMRISYIEDLSLFWSLYWKGNSHSIHMELPKTGGEREKKESGVIMEYLIEGILELVE